MSLRLLVRTSRLQLRLCGYRSGPTGSGSGSLGFCSGSVGVAQGTAQGPQVSAQALWVLLRVPEVDSPP